MSFWDPQSLQVTDMLHTGTQFYHYVHEELLFGKKILWGPLAQTIPSHLFPLLSMGDCKIRLLSWKKTQTQNQKSYTWKIPSCST